MPEFIDGVANDVPDLRRPLDVLNGAVHSALVQVADDGEVVRRYTEDNIVMMLDFKGSHYHVTVGKVYRKEL